MNTSTKRRVFLKGSMAATAVGVAVGAGLLTPRAVLAAWPEEAFKIKELGPAMKALLGSDTADTSADIEVKAPDIAENGAVVPVEVSSGIPNTISLAVLVDKNPLPLSSAFDFANGALPEMALRLKMGQTSLVEAVAKTADGKYHKARKEVKVTVGGCGG